MDIDLLIASGLTAQIGSVSLIDSDTGVQADITAAGLDVNITNTNPIYVASSSEPVYIAASGTLDVDVVSITNPVRIGSTVQVAIDSTERLLDTTPLSLRGGYPMWLELEARDEACYIIQGDSLAALSGINYRVLADEWVIVNCDSDDDAYFAVQATDLTSSGTLTATRRDIDSRQGDIQ